MQTLVDIRTVIFAVIAFLTFYKTVYRCMGFFIKAKKFDPAPQTKKYGIVIAARNEELVIGNLVDSLHEQTYPKDKFQVFVVADNCDPDDRTAEINKQAEEMFNTLIEQLKKSEGITEQLKADNQMKWVCKMNNIHQRATKIVNSELIYN